MTSPSSPQMPAQFCGVQALHEDGDSIHSLQRLLSEPRADLPRPERISLARGIAAGMAHLHGASVGPNARPVIHADLKSANVLLSPTTPGFGTAQYVPKISDFGLSRLRGSVTATANSAGAPGGASGTLAWMAPELLGGGRPTEDSGARRACCFTELADLCRHQIVIRAGGRLSTGAK